MESHVRALGILHIVLSSLGLLVAVIVLMVSSGIAGLSGLSGGDDAGVVSAGFSIIGTGIGLLVLLVSIPGMIAGIGLLKLRPWARLLGIVISAINLVSIPIGTAVGIYGLWVLLSADSQRLFAVPSTRAATAAIS